MSRLSNFPGEKDGRLPEETLNTSASMPEMTAEDCKGSDSELFEAVRIIRNLFGLTEFCDMPLVTRMKLDTGRTALVKLDMPKEGKVRIECKGIDNKDDDRIMTVVPPAEDASDNDRERVQAFDIGVVKSILRFIKEGFQQK